jgi:hypothetical protein
VRLEMEALFRKELGVEVATEKIAS